MKNIIPHFAIGIRLMIMVLGMSGFAMAADEMPRQTLAVTAAIQALCTTPISGGLSFTIDPLSTTDTVAAVTTPAKVLCTNGKSVTMMAASSGSGITSATGTLAAKLKDADNNEIPYTLTFTSVITGLGFGNGKDVNINISGMVSAANLQSAVYSNSYGDSITLTIGY